MQLLFGGFISQRDETWVSCKSKISCVIYSVHKKMLLCCFQPAVFFLHLLTLITCRPGTIFFGRQGPRALKNTRSNYSTSVLVLFPPLKPCRQSLLTSASLLTNIVQMPTSQCSSFWCAWLKLFFLCQCAWVFVCMCLLACGWLCICVCVCVCASWD